MSDEHVPDEASRYLVRTAAGFCTQKQIALLVRISVGTLTKYYKEELEYGEAQKTFDIAKTQFGIATDPDNKSCAAVGMWWLERRGGEDWRPPEKRLKVEGEVSHTVGKPVIDATKMTFEQRQRLKEFLLELEASQKALTQDVVAEQDKKDEDK